MKYIFIAFLIVIFILLCKYYFKQLLFKQIKRNINNYFIKNNKKFTIISSNNNCYDWLIETDENIFICKLFFTKKFDNLIITNPTTWILTRDSEPILITNRLKNVEDFLNFQPSVNKNINKIAILHPKIKQIRKYINENEMIIINLNEKVNDCRFITSNNLTLLK